MMAMFGVPNLPQMAENMAPLVAAAEKTIEIGKEVGVSLWQPVGQVLNLAEIATIAPLYNLFTNDTYQLTPFSRMVDVKSTGEAWREGLSYSLITAPAVGGFDLMTGRMNGDSGQMMSGGINIALNLIGARGLSPKVPIQFGGLSLLSGLRFSDDIGYRGMPIGSVPELAGFPQGTNYRVDFSKHLFGPDGLNKKGGLSGTHNLNNAISVLDSLGATYSMTQISTLGIYELGYTYLKPSGKLIKGSVKTVYDPILYSDEQMRSMAATAGRLSYEKFALDEAKYFIGKDLAMFDVRVGGVNFRTYLDRVGGVPRIGTVFPVR